MSVQTTYSTAMGIAKAGLVISSPSGGIDSMRNSQAVTGVALADEMAFGRAVAFAGSTDDKGAIIPSGASDKICGIVCKSLAYGIAPYGDLGTVGVQPGGTVNVMRKGVLWAVCEDGCAPGDRLWVRRTAAGDPEFLGGLNNADDSTDMIDCTSQGVWKTTASAGGLAKLEVDFTAKQADAS
jgi:hypothetical protein